MKKIGLSLLLILLSLPVFAWTIGPMNYQGRLLNNSGVPVTGSHTFKVRIYDAASGGTLKFSEQHTAVAVNDGVYSFLVSTGTNSTGSWDINLWNSAALYLEIEVSGETLTPRHLLASTPFAFQANLALTTNNALSLGGKPSSWFDSTLEAICVSGKGKWLELANSGAGACLGVGASFPGPTRVNWNTLTASNDFKNLDLTRANISGINFSSPSIANMTGTLFNNTTYSVAGISGANLTNTQWDGAASTDTAAYTVATNTNLTGATMKNMDLSDWNFSSITNSMYFTNFSAAYLSACPAAVFSFATYPWQCKLMRATGSNYFMVGPYANFSTTSAAATTAYGVVVLDVDTAAFDNTQLRVSSFVGVTLTQQFDAASLYQADMRYAKLKDVLFSPSNLTLVKLANSEWESVIMPAGITMNLSDFSNARLSNVYFYNNVGVGNFAKATLKNVDFGGSLNGVNFTDSTLENVRINSSGNGGGIVTFDRTRIYGNFHIASLPDVDAPAMIFKDMGFYGATVSGDLTDVNFTGTLTFKNTTFKNLDLCSTSFPLVDTTAPHDDLLTVKWEGPVECPDATDVAGSATLYTGTCNNATRMTPVGSLTACNSGIPGGLQ